MTGDILEQAYDRVARALVDAEEGVPGIRLDDAALRILALDAGRLAATVPYAVCALAGELARHTRAAVRIEAVRLLDLAMPRVGEATRAALQRLATDRSAQVRSAAARALVQLGPGDAWDEGQTIIDGAPTIVEAPRAPLPVPPRVARG